MADILTHLESGVTMRYGIVCAIDAQTHRVRVRMPDMDIDTWWLAVLVPSSHGDRYYGLPDIGAHVACLLDTRGESGVVLGSLYSGRDATPVDGAPDRRHVSLADGTTVDYDRRTHRLSLHCTGDVEVVSDTRISLRAPRIELN